MGRSEYWKAVTIGGEGGAAVGGGIVPNEHFCAENILSGDGEGWKVFSLSAYSLKAKNF